MPRLPPFSARAFSARALATPTPLGAAARPRLPLPSRACTPVPVSARAFSFDAAAGELATASEAAAAFPPVQFLSDLLLAVPTPSYGLSIIVLTLLLRFGVTTPMTLWQRKRNRRNLDIIVPQMKEINDRLAVQLVGDARREGLSYDDYRKRLKKALAKEQSALHKKHGTHPFITVLAPLAVHIPVLVITSMAIRHAMAVPDSALAADSFLWIPKLIDPDPAYVLPLLGGLLAFGNAELSSQKRAAQDKAIESAVAPKTPSDAGVNAVDAAAAQKAAAPSAKRSFSTSAVRGATPPPRRRRTTPAAGTQAPTAFVASTPVPRSSMAKPKLEDIESAETQEAAMSLGHRLFDMLNGAMRLFALVFLPIAGIMPSVSAELVAPLTRQGVVLYWVTSISFSLCQSVYFSRLDRRDAAARASRRIISEGRARL
ncbi:hypothetical protein VHUM_02801 [Vanrija humicola]|uniref:Membrane insertase YidC/Oxa/ALB C-terminal domain-containing protein n=1 Tax=Vanrija humicola TaxID=5417 RepID=A0A7D8UZ22_VANHU|nr:hypothetical protein VHUM_02801 [Vanrija humicola]